VVGAEHAPEELAGERHRHRGRVVRDLAGEAAGGVEQRAGSTTRLTSPPASASSAGNTRPVATHSMARLMPTTRGRNQLLQASGTMPRRANTKPMRAPLAAMRTSIGSVIVAPTPTAAR
jgi:hypothetical protein